MDGPVHRLGSPAAGGQVSSIAVQPLAAAQDSRQHIIGDILHTVTAHVGHGNSLLARRRYIHPVITAAVDRNSLAAFQLFDGRRRQRHVDLRQYDIGPAAKGLQVRFIVIGGMAYPGIRQFPGQQLFLHLVIRPFLINDPDQFSSHNITPPAGSGCLAPHPAQPASRPALLCKIPVPYGSPWVPQK